MTDKSFSSWMLDRRKFVKTTAVAGTAFALGLHYAPAAAAEEGANVWAYPSAYTIDPGAALSLHMSGSVTTAQIDIYSITQWRQTAWADPALAGEIRKRSVTAAVPATHQGPNNTKTNPGVEDWKWPAVDIDLSNPPLPPGYYVAVVRAPGVDPSLRGLSWVPFIVRKPAGTRPASILYKVSLNTMQAYNYGPLAAPEEYKNSFYGSPRQDDDGRLKVTFRRPFTHHTVRTWLMDYDYPLVCWLRRQEYDVDFCTDIDLHLDGDGTLLEKYDVVLSTGHDEYWSREMYDHLVSYRDRGGNLVFLSGNTCCWEVTYSDPDGNLPTAMLCGKEPHTKDVIGDAAWGWRTTPLDNALVGAGTRNCATRESPIVAPFAPPFPYSDGYRVQNLDHWVFDGTGIAREDVIGSNNRVRPNGPRTGLIENIIGPEGNGARIAGFNADKTARLALNDGTPPNLALLGVAITGPDPDVPTVPDDPMEPVFAADCGYDCRKWKVFSREGAIGTRDDGVYAATMGHYAAYGSVFTASTINWSNVLNEWDAHGGEYRQTPPHWKAASTYDVDDDGHPILGNFFLHRITRNVLDAFSTRQRDVRAVVGDLLVMQAQGTGEPSFWRMDGAQCVGTGSILYAGDESPGRRRRIAAAVLTDETPVLVLQDELEGGIHSWTLTRNSDGSIARTATGRLRPDWADAEWRLCLAVGVPGAASEPAYCLVFQHQYGSLYYWQLEGTRMTAAGELNPTWWDPIWRPVTALDVDGDGHEDLVFQNDESHELYYWRMNGMNVLGGGALVSAEAGPKRLVGAYDVTGDGHKDLVLQDRDTGALSYWSLAVDRVTTQLGGSLGGSSPRFLARRS